MSLSTEQLQKLDEIRVRAEKDGKSDIVQYIRERNIPNVFYVDEHGLRCVRRADIKLFARKDERGYRRVGSKAWTQSTVNNRNFLLPKTTPATAKARLAPINKPRKPSLQLFSHPSEPGWRLPRNHKRHWLKLPQEIRDLIVGHAVRVNDLGKIRPLVISSNWKSQWSEPRHEIITPNQNNREEILTLRTSARDAQGSYTEIVRIRRREIDSTILRANKMFMETGIRFLYENPFHFDMSNPSFRRSPPYMLPDKSIWQPEPRKPIFTRNPDLLFQKDLKRIGNGVESVRLRKPITSLPGWIYYDPFLRFLYTIGPENAKYLKDLTFSGIAQIHECEMYGCQDCDDDLVTNLRIYIIPFIIQICPNVERITILAKEDFVFPTRPYRLLDNEPKNMKEALIPLLENEIRKIPRLKYLKVQDVSSGEELLLPSLLSAGLQSGLQQSLEKG